jgi:hypothetical protein
MPSKKIAKQSDKPRTNRLAESLLEQDEDLGLALDAALDAAEQVLQKKAQGTIWAGKYEPLQLSALFEQHIRTHFCEELLAIAEYGDFKHWLEAGKPEPSFDHERKGAHITYDGPHGKFLAEYEQRNQKYSCKRCPQEYEGIIDLIKHVRDSHGPMDLKEAVDLCRAWRDEVKTPLHRRYCAVTPGITRMRSRYIDVIGGHEKDHEGMDAALKYAHKALGKSVNVKLVPVSDTKPNVTITL